MNGKIGLMHNKQDDSKDVNSRITAATTNARFLAADEDMYAAEAEYQVYETDLARQISSIETDYPGYHAYHYDVAPIGHDPYVLIAILSAIKADFCINDPEIRQIFAELRRPRRQYTLTISKSLASEFDEQFAGVDIDRLEPRYLELNVKFTNYDLYCVVDSLLNHDQLMAYAGYLRSRGCRPDLFPADKYPNVIQWQEPIDYHIPGERLEKYPLLEREMAIAMPFMGYPYVWSGSEPDTSFDCSGFISYILDEMGLKYRNVIRGKSVHLPVSGSKIDGVFYDGLFEKCQELPADLAEPGDLVFFAGSFDVSSYRPANLSHVGIYVGDDVFLACGEPYGVRYWSYDEIHPGTDKPWRDFIACYGRLPVGEQMKGKNE